MAYGGGLLPWFCWSCACFSLSPSRLFWRWPAWPASLLTENGLYCCWLLDCRQAIFTVAHALYLVYSLHFGIWVLYIPQLIEIVLMFVMIVAKFYFDYIRPKRIKDKAGIDGTPT